MVSNITTKFKLKRGDTFILSGNYLKDDNDNVIPLVGYVIRAHVRDDRNNLVDTLTVDIDTVENTYSIRSDNTMSYPVCDLYWDVEFTDPEGVVFSTETMGIEVLKDITY